MHYYFDVLKKYATFGGRARRAEYWYFQLFNTLAIFALIILGAMFDVGMALLIVGLYFLAVFLPALAVGVRRLHDIDFSGWWLLLSFVPFGGLVLFIFSVMPGTKGPNRFGDDPITGPVPAIVTTPVAAVPVVESTPAVPQTTTQAEPATWSTSEESSSESKS